jgi:hypothetical protein
MRPTVRFKIAETTLTIACSGSGDLILTGDRTDSIGRRKVGELTHYIHENLISRGWTLSDELRVAQKIIKQFGGEILGYDKIRESIRRSWMKLLKRHLMPDPAQLYGKRSQEYLTTWFLLVKVQAGETYVAHTGGPHYHGKFYLGNPDYLVVYRTNKRPWRARWERITRIEFSYLEPQSTKHPGRPSKRARTALSFANA